MNLKNSTYYYIWALHNANVNTFSDLKIQKKKNKFNKPNLTDQFHLRTTTEAQLLWVKCNKTKCHELVSILVNFLSERLSRQKYFATQLKVIDKIMPILYF